MPIYSLSPALWSLQDLISHGGDAVLDLAVQSAGTFTSQQYLAGRCLLAIDHLKAYEKHGLSSSIHFATRFLGMKAREARTVRRVARRLEELPQLQQAALHGEVWWSQLREVTSVATPETEELWLELCHRMSCDEIAKLVALTPYGGTPGDVASPEGRRTSEYRCRFRWDVVQLIERVLATMSRREGRPVTFAQGVERLFGQALEGGAFDEEEGRLREEVRKELLSEELAQEPLVARAREAAKELGLAESSSAGTTVGNPLEEPQTGSAESTVAGVESSHPGRRHAVEASRAFPVIAPEPSGVPIDAMGHLRFNPRARHPSAAQRKALLRRDRYCCSTPGCPNHIWLEIHHLKRFCEGGETVPDQLITLCSRCHKHVHEGKLHLEGTVSSGLLFRDSSGRDLRRHYQLERAMWLDYWLGWHDSAHCSYTRRVHTQSAPLRAA